MRTRGLPFILVTVACLLGACGSDGSSSSSSRDGRAGRSTTEADDAAVVGDAAPTGVQIQLGAGPTAKLNAFFDSPSVLLGDEVVVDASRKPFLSKMSYSQSRVATQLGDGSYGPAVRLTERMDGARGVLIMTFENMTGTTGHMDSLPRVRFGDGFEVYATKRLVVRFWTAQTEERPIHITASASGRALYEAPDTGVRHAGDVVKLVAEAISMGSGYRFESLVEAR